MDYRTRYTSPEWLKRLKKLAYDYFGHTGVDVDDAFQDAVLNLLKNLDKLESSRPDGVNDAYIFTMFRNAMTSVYHHHFGKPRPPEWVKRLGPIWKQIFDMLCLQRLPEYEIETRMQARFTAMEVDVEPVQPGDAIRELKARQACPDGRPQHVSIDADADDEEQTHEPADDEFEAVQQMGASEVAILLQALLRDDAEQERLDQLSDSVVEQWQSITRQVAIDDEQRLILKLVFQEGNNVAKAARLLDKPVHNVRRPMQRALQHIREVFEANAINLEIL